MPPKMPPVASTRCRNRAVRSKRPMVGAVRRPDAVCAISSIADSTPTPPDAKCSTASCRIWREPDVKWLNHRFANANVSDGQQYEDHFNPADSFPFSYAETTDHLTGRRDAIL